jgi:quercetin dioxygenase-like cupin family protein
MSDQASPMTFALEEQGETLTFYGEADNTAPRVEFDVQIAPGAVGPERHIHPKQRERFAVTSGRMLATVGGVEHLLGPGDELQVEA